MIRFAIALSLGALLLGAASSAQAQQAAAPTATQKAAPAAGANCKKIYVQKKSARTGNYVQVPRQRCS